MYKRFPILLLSMLLVLFVVLAPTASYAASVNLDPIYHMLNDCVQTLLEGAAMIISGWVMVMVHKYVTPWFGAQMEAKARDSLNTALANGVAIALNKVEGVERMHMNVEVKGQLAAWAAQYAIDHAPGAVDRFGLSPSQLALKALAYVPPAPQMVDTTGNLPPPIPKVETGTLDDLTPNKTG